MPGYGDKTTTTKTGKKTTWWLYGSARQPEGEVRVQWWVQKKSKTFDLQNLTISPTSPNVGSCQICQKIPQCILEILCSQDLGVSEGVDGETCSENTGFFKQKL